MPGWTGEGCIRAPRPGWIPSRLCGDLIDLWSLCRTVVYCESPEPNYVSKLGERATGQCSEHRTVRRHVAVSGGVRLVLFNLGVCRYRVEDVRVAVGERPPPTLHRSSSPASCEVKCLGGVRDAGPQQPCSLSGSSPNEVCCVRRRGEYGVSLVSAVRRVVRICVRRVPCSECVSSRSRLFVPDGIFVLTPRHRFRTAPPLTSSTTCNFNFHTLSHIAYSSRQHQQHSSTTCL